MIITLGDQGERGTQDGSFKTIAAVTAAGDTALWTPAAGKKWQLSSVGIWLTSNCSQTSAGIITLLLRDVTTPISGCSWSFYVPAAAALTGEATRTWSWGLGPVAAATATALNVNLSAALLTGAFEVHVDGWEV